MRVHAASTGASTPFAFFRLQPNLRPPQTPPGVRGFSLEGSRSPALRSPIQSKHLVYVSK